MTDTELAQHRKANNLGWQIGRALMVISVLVMFSALGILFHQQESYQDCQFKWQAGDSQARNIRSEASAKTALAQRDAFEQAADVIDPTKTPSMTQLQDLQAALDAYGKAADSYEGKIKQYPYTSLKETCG